MKRSEMVKKMTDHWLAIFIPNDKSFLEEGVYEEVYANMDRLLRVQEKAGILPPTTEFKLGDKTVKDNTWEKEDENPS